MLDTMVRGAGGGSSSDQPRTPVEAPDSLHSTAFAHILDILSEGEIYGFADNSKPLSCMYYNETPIANPDGSLNFKNVQVDYRFGTQTQDYIKGFDSVESENIVNLELGTVTSWTHTITNLNLSAIRIMLAVPTLSQADTTTGDLNGYSIGYKIELSVDGGAFANTLVGAMTGKTSSKYERSHRIDLPNATSYWTIRVTRLTAKQTSSAINDVLILESYTDVIDAKLRMPMTALCASIIDARQFNSIPSRAFHMKGRIIRVPTNYNATTRAYTGIWDGTFQTVYCNNPAWVFFDMVTNARYGLGHLVSDSLIDKWGLYKIAKYCDVLVSDGRGGTEPRFTANLYLQTQGDALRVLQDMASMFRGILYAAGGSIMSVADMPDDPIYQYAPANVIEGRFTYQGSGRKVRHTVVLVSWNDMSDMGRAKVEYVDDKDGIARYGVLPTEVIAVGCTSQSQARRLGKYLLATERYETDGVSFGVGQDGVIPAPGKIIKIADPIRAGKRMGGRIQSTLANHVTLDAIVAGDAAIGDTLNVIGSDGVLESHPITGVSGNVIGVAAFTTPPVPQSVWVIEKASLAAQTFRVLSVTERPDGSGYDITGLQHVPGKYDFVENDIAIVEPPISARAVVPAPGTVTLTNRVVTANGTAFNVINADWANVKGALSYQIEWQKDNGPWSAAPPVKASMDEYEGARAGTYRAKVWCIDARGFTSKYTMSNSITVGEAAVPVMDLGIDHDGSVTIDCRYSQFRLNLTKNVSMVYFTHVAPQDTIIIQITQNAAWTITWPSSVQSADGKPYVVSAVAGAKDVVGLNTINEGFLWLLTAQKPGASAPGGAITATIAPSPATASSSTDGVTASHPSVGVATTATGGTAPLTHKWTRGDTAGGTNFLISSTTVANPTFSIADGVTAYNITQTWRDTITDANGFTGSKTVVITLKRVITGAFSVAITGSTTGYCDVASGPCSPSVTLTATPTGGSGTVTYAWTRVDTAGGTNFLIDNAAAATVHISKPSASLAIDITQTWRCTATCSTGSDTADVIIELSRDNSTL